MYYSVWKPEVSKKLAGWKKEKPVYEQNEGERGRKQKVSTKAM